MLHKLRCLNVGQRLSVTRFENAVLHAAMTTDNYKDAVLKAVNLGDDTDTTGAVTGALAGLAYGLDSIPQEWREQLAAYDEVRRIAVAMPRWDYFRKIA